jgi:hypothetical protein
MDIKIWCVVCSVAKFVWNLSFYYGKEEAPSTIGPVARGKPKLAYKLVMELSKDIEGKNML